jgi:hypothetical protein
MARIFSPAEAEKNNIAERYIKSIVNNKARQRSQEDFYHELYGRITEKYPVRGSIRKFFIPDEQVGSQSALEWYNVYLKRLNDLQKSRTRGRLTLDDEAIIPYPFKSKASKYLQKHSSVKYEVIPTNPIVDKEQFQKPTFSKHFGTYEIDLVYYLTNPNNKNPYLFCINVNTRYLVIIPLPYKTDSAIKDGFNEILHQFRLSNEKYHTDRFVINHIKGDGERGFNSR